MNGRYGSGRGKRINWQFVNRPISPSVFLSIRSRPSPSPKPFHASLFFTFFHNPGIKTTKYVRENNGKNVRWSGQRRKEKKNTGIQGLLVKWKVEGGNSFNRRPALELKCSTTIDQTTNGLFTFDQQLPFSWKKNRCSFFLIRLRQRYLTPSWFASILSPLSPLCLSLLSYISCQLKL